MSYFPRSRSRFLAAIFLNILAAPATAQSGLYTWDFDDGTLQGWMPISMAFANQPTYGNNVVIRRPGESPGQDGNYWIGSYENHPSNAVPPGPVQGDGPQGSLVSPAFRIDGNAISFLIGGGSDRTTEFLGLLIKSRPGLPPPPRPNLVYGMPDGAYQLTLVATGRDDEHMMRTIWDVTHFRGETARIIAVDQSSGHWGHLNFDSVNLPWQPPLGRAVPVGLGRAVPVNPEPPATDLGTLEGGPYGGGAYPPAQPGLGTAVVVNPGRAQPPVYVPPAQPGLGTAQPVSQGPVTAYPVGGGQVIVSPPAAGSGQVRQAPENIPEVARPLGGEPRPHGRFRLVVLEIDVLHQTRDDLTESDGPADEIQVRGNMFNYSRAGRLGDFETRWSGIFGSEGHADFIAGTALPAFSAHSDYGGLKTGDWHPRRPRPIQTSGDLPWMMWEGELVEGGDGVVIVPSLWEIDSRSESPAQRTWERTIVDNARRSPQSIELAFTQTVEDRNSPVNDYLMGSVPVQDDGNRPIGAGEHPGFQLPVGALPHPSGTKLYSIPLTYERARFFAARPASSIEIPAAPGMTGGQRNLPRGAIVIRMTDRPGMEGDYLMILQLEQIN